MLRHLSRLELQPRSDHDAILISGLGRASISSKSSIGKCRWSPYVEGWQEAGQSIEHSLNFVGDFILHLLLDTFLRDSVISNHWVRLRQALVDLVVWWRAALLVLAGHLSGLAVTAKPPGTPGGFANQDIAKDFAKVSKFLAAARSDPGLAQGRLTNFLKPNCRCKLPSLIP